MKKFNTPVVVITYNRPDTLINLLNVLQKVKPAELFIVSDGPKNSVDKVKVDQVRDVLKNKIDWECNLIKIYSDKNLGLKRRVVTGLNRVFSQVDRAIILEDDCIPDLSFFPFCQELLEKFKDNQKILSISGSNFLPEDYKIDESYYFSKYFHSWGWATWKRAWGKYDSSMSIWEANQQNTWLNKIFKHRKEVFYWKTIFDAVKLGKIDSWAYRWLLSHFNKNSYSIIPNNNLVTNIGFGKIATNTKFRTKNISSVAQAIAFPLKHPNSVKANVMSDEYIGLKIFASFKNILASLYKKYW